MARALALTFFIVLTAIAAGCGGNSEKALSKSQFVERGNKICQKATKERDAAMAEAVEKKAGIAWQRDNTFLRQIVSQAALPTLVQMTDELEDLGEPTSATPGASAVIDSLREGIETIEGDPIKALAADDNPLEEARKKAAAYGLEECASF